MISETALDLAVARDVLSAAQAEELRTLARAEVEAVRASLPPPPAMPPPLPVSTASAVPDTNAFDDESLRFITSFADIFVTLGIALFCWAGGGHHVTLCGRYGEMGRRRRAGVGAGGILHAPPPHGVAEHRSAAALRNCHLQIRSGACDARRRWLLSCPPLPAFRGLGQYRRALRTDRGIGDGGVRGASLLALPRSDHDCCRRGRALHRVRRVGPLDRSVARIEYL